MSSHTDSIDVASPIRQVYDQWTQLEAYPKFMDHVTSIEQTADDTAHWVVDIGGVSREFDATITEQHPDERIAWTTTEGPEQAGVVTFHRIEEDVTRVTLQMDFEPDGVVEQAGDKLGFVGHSVTNSLKKFKEFIESRGDVSGGWRGDIAAPGSEA